AAEALFDFGEGRTARLRVEVSPRARFLRVISYRTEPRERAADLLIAREPEKFRGAVQHVAGSPNEVLAAHRENPIAILPGQEIAAQKAVQEPKRSAELAVRQLLSHDLALEGELSQLRAQSPPPAAQPPAAFPG